MLDGLTEGGAPFHQALAEGPEGRARWIWAADGVRLRAVRWAPEGARGTVLVFPGRAEYAEKYGRVAADLVAGGHAVLAVDWRGQGLSDRLRPERALGHVERFEDYQLDVAALAEHARGLGLPEPWFLLSHSMGGTIGLRALLEGLPVKAAAFSSPMWGLRMTAAQRPVAWSVSSVSRALALGYRLAPGQEATPSVLACGFAGNLLTSDGETWDWLRAQVTAGPELALGGPSLHWLHEALREMRRLMAGPAPDVPALALVGSEEAVVDSARIRRRLADWPGARLLTLEGGRHELLMERPMLRGQALAEILGHFARP